MTDAAGSCETNFVKNLFSNFFSQNRTDCHVCATVALAMTIAAFFAENVAADVFEIVAGFFSGFDNAGDVDEVFVQT